jgi:hypothetical protein
VACSGAKIEDLYEFNASSGTTWEKSQIRSPLLTDAESAELDDG